MWGVYGPDRVVESPCIKLGTKTPGSFGPIPLIGTDPCLARGDKVVDGSVVLGVERIPHRRCNLGESVTPCSVLRQDRGRGHVSH